MADITKCNGENCPLRQTCYRYTAMASIWQSYFAVTPFHNGVCTNYWHDEVPKKRKGEKTMVKFICDMCGKELSYSEVVKMETKVKSNNSLINEKLTVNDFVLTEACVPCAKKLLGEERIAQVVSRHKEAEEKMVGGYKPRFIKRDSNND